MGFLKGLFIVGLLLGALWYFAPDAFNAGKNWVFDSFNMIASKNPTEKLNYTMTENGMDYGKAFGFIGCTTNEDCAKYFKTEMNCSLNATCFIGVE
jgi:hypothetical protein